MTMTLVAPPSEHDRLAAHEARWRCPSCGAPATTYYCGNCGEERLGVAQATDDGAGSDRRRSFVGRALASLRALASPPGRLTADWIRGKRVGYLSPLSLFLWVNVAFFLVQSVTRLGILTWPLSAHLSDDLFGWLTTRLLVHHRSDATLANNDYAHIFNALESVHAKSLVILMVPALAIALGALLVDRRAPFKDLLTLATHFFAFALIWLCALFPTVAVVLDVVVLSGQTPPSPHSMDLIVTGLEAGVLGWYIYEALKTVYDLSVLRRSITSIVLIAALFVTLKVYHIVVFAVTLYST